MRISDWSSDVCSSDLIVAGDAGLAGFSIGDKVCALLAGGGYAEYCTAPAAQCLPVPKGLSDVEAAGLPETYYTVWSNVFDRGELSAGESLMVHGGTRGVRNGVEEGTEVAVGVIQSGGRRITKKK